MRELGVGIIGFGRIGAEHAGWIARTPGARVSAVCDFTPARRELATSRGFQTTGSVESLLATRDVDAVLVATPTAFHFDHATACLRAGKHVMVEKPMALDLEQSLKLIDEAERRKLTLSVFQNRRWDEDYLAVRALLASGTLGKIINVESRLGQFASCVGPAAKEYRPGWRNEGAFGGGGLYDWGSHFVDQLWRLMIPRKPVRVFAQLRGNVWTTDCDDFARVCVDFDDGAVGLVEINTTTTRPLPRWHIDGTQGSASSPHSPTFDTKEWANLTVTAVDPVEPKPPITPEPRLDEVMIWEQFANACAGSGEPAVPARSVLMTMKLLDAARVSSREGRVVAIVGMDDRMMDPR